MDKYENGIEPEESKTDRVVRIEELSYKLAEAVWKVLTDNDLRSIVTMNVFGDTPVINCMDIAYAISKAGCTIGNMICNERLLDQRYDGAMDILEWHSLCTEAIMDMHVRCRDEINEIKEKRMENTAKEFEDNDDDDLDPIENVICMMTKNEKPS